MRGRLSNASKWFWGATFALIVGGTFFCVGTMLADIL